jgi:hypothetical protein
MGTHEGPCSYGKKKKMWAHEGLLKKEEDSHVLIRLRIYKRERERERESCNEIIQLIHQIW